MSSRAIFARIVRIVSLIALLALGFTLSACGQRGALVAPAIQTNTETPQQEPGLSAEEKARKSQTKAPEKEFFLDKLL